MTTPIIDKQAAVSFQVDTVEHGSKRFEKCPVAEILVKDMGRKLPEKDETSMSMLSQPALDPYKLIGHSPCPNILMKDVRTGHPVLHAVHYAFDNHLPLTFSPDTFYQLILQGVAQHIANAPEEYRRQFVSHDGQKTLSILREDLSLGDLPALGRQINSVVDSFVDELAGHVPEAYLKLFDGEFSTTTRAEVIAAKVTCMDAFSPYFGYHMYCGCGLPKITLMGSPEDWRRLHAKVTEIEELFWVDEQTNLMWWTAKLRQITEQLIAAASSQPDIVWWKRMYKQIDVYMNHAFNGWIGWMWPYTRTASKWDGKEWIKPERDWQRNPMLDDISDTVTIVKSSWFTPPPDNDEAKQQVIRTITLDDSNQRNTRAIMDENYRGSCFMTTDVFPMGLSKVDLKITDVMMKKTLETVLIGGFFGVSQDEDGGLKPEIGYALLA